MKKSLILGILGLTAGAVSSYGQGAVYIDNYQTSGPLITFSGALGGGGVDSTFTIGLYYGPANVNAVSSVAADASGFALPTSLYSSFILASGANSTAAWAVPGEFTPNGSFVIQPSAATPAQSSYTMMVVAYNGADYADSTIRGHSTAFYLQDANPSVNFGADLGNSFSAFSVYSVVSAPEPSSLALAGLGGFGMLMAFRRKKA